MSNESCELCPKINGKPSKLFLDLNNKLGKNRPLTKYIYACYLQKGVAELMTKLGYQVNSLNLHNAEDVYKFFNGAELEREVSPVNVASVEKKVGSKDDKGNYIEYTNAKEALDKAYNLNTTTKGVVASVIKFGDNYRIIVEPRTSKSQYKVVEVEEYYKLWSTIEQFFSLKGIDINSSSQQESLRNVLNPLNSKYIPTLLSNLKNTSNKYLLKNEISLLFELNPNNTGVKRLIVKYGSIENAVDKVYENYRNIGNLSATELRLIENTINQCKSFKNLDIESLKQLIALESLNYKKDSEEVSILTIIKELNEKYGIDSEEIYLKNENIKSLYEAAAHAAVTILRLIKKLEENKDNEDRSKQLETTLKLLTSELKSKHYYAGSLNFLNEALNLANYIQELLKNIPEGVSEFLKAKYLSSAILEIENLHLGYFYIINALCNIDSIASDEDISSIDKQTLEEKAREVKALFEAQKEVIKDLKDVNLLHIATNFLGDNDTTKLAIANFTKASQADSSWFDYFYAVSRASDPLVNLMGGIARRAQDTRDAKMNEIMLRLRRANNILKKAGINNTKFMYDEDGNIVSPYDWKKYNKAKAKKIKELKKLKFRGISLKEAILTWEDENTEDVIVDLKNGRTEKMPNEKYYKTDMGDMATWSEALRLYYDDVMLIKGEIGSLLPVYALHLYLPPLVRRAWVDGIAEAVKNRSLKGALKVTKLKIESFYKVLEDDTDFASNGMIDGEEVAFSHGNFDNTILKRIPIFHVNKLKNLEELDKDFTRGIALLANTAINYDAMSLVKDILEFVGEYAKDRKILEKKGGMTKAERVFDSGVTIFRELTKKAESTNTSNIIDGFLDAQLYKVKFNNTNKYTKGLSTMLAYNSAKALAVNLKGAVVNNVNGIYLIFIEAAAGEYFNYSDFAWAIGRMSFDLVTGAPGKIMDFFSGNKNSIDFLLAEKFDPIPGRFNKQGHLRFSGNIFRLLWGHDFTYTMYEVGEFFIHYLVMYSMLHHKKVLIDGKKNILYNAFTKVNKLDGNTEVVLKDNVTNLNGTVYTEDDNELYRKKIRVAAQSCHGAMTEEDKGAVHLYMLGKFIMNLRQWMVEYYSKRFRKEYIDASTGEKRSGMWYDTRRLISGYTAPIYNNIASKMLNNYVEDVSKYQILAVLHWKTMEPYLKANVKRVLAETFLLSGLFGMSWALGEPEDHKKEFWYRMWIYSTRRAILDIESGYPIFRFKAFETIINSPIPAVNTFGGMLYPITGLAHGDFMKELQSGPYDGWNLYLRNILKYSIPYYWQLSQLYNMDEDESVFKFLENTK